MNHKISQGKGCSSISLVGYLIIVALVTIFLFGNKKLGNILIDIAIWIVIAPIIIGILYMGIFRNKK